MTAPSRLLVEIIEEARSALEGDETYDLLVAHLAALAGAGASPVKLIDEALLFLLHRAEAHAVRKGAAVEDPLRVRSLLWRFASYPERLRASGCIEAAVDLRNKRKNLQVMVTRRCNLRCSYCPVEKGDRSMSGGMLRKAADFLLSGSADKVRLDFTGGEPLYMFDEVLGTCRWAVEKAERLGKHISFYMVTNGTLLEKRMVRELAKLPIFLEISFDGKEDVHNRFKIPVEAGTNPYLLTRRAIDLLLEESVKLCVVMVATPEVVDRLAESFDHAVEVGARIIDINYAVGTFWSQKVLDRYLAQLRDILKRYAFDLTSGRLAIGNLQRRVEPTILNAEWMADVDGSLHLMTEWVFPPPPGHDSNTSIFGSLTGGGTFDDLYADRFHAYFTLLCSAGWRDARIRRIIHNNIEVGRRVGKFFAEQMGAVVSGSSVKQQ